MKRRNLLHWLGVGTSIGLVGGTGLPVEEPEPTPEDEPYDDQHEGCVCEDGSDDYDGVPFDTPDVSYRGVPVDRNEDRIDVYVSVILNDFSRYVSKSLEGTEPPWRARPTFRTSDNVADVYVGEFSRDVQFHDEYRGAGEGGYYTINGSIKRPNVEDE